MLERFLDDSVLGKTGCHAIRIRLWEFRHSFLQDVSDGGLGNAVFCHAENRRLADFGGRGILWVAFCPSKVVPIGIFFVFQSPMMFWFAVVHKKEPFTALFDHWKWEEMTLRVIFPRMVAVNDVIIVAGFGISIEHRPCGLELCLDVAGTFGKPWEIGSVKTSDEVARPDDISFIKELRSIHGKAGMLEISFARSIASLMGILLLGVAVGIDGGKEHERTACAADDAVIFGRNSRFWEFSKRNGLEAVFDAICKALNVCPLLPCDDGVKMHLTHRFPIPGVGILVKKGNLMRCEEGLDISDAPWPVIGNIVYERGFAQIVVAVVDAVVFPYGRKDECLLHLRRIF